MKQRRHLLPVILSGFFLTGLLSLMPGTRAAPLMCHTDFEAITTLRPPRLGMPSIWDAVYTQPDKIIQFASGVPTGNGMVMAAGRSLDKKTHALQDIVLAEINSRGRVMNEKTWPAKPGETPVKIVALKNGYALLSSVGVGDKKAPSTVRLSWYGDDGSFIKSATIADGGYDYEAESLAPLADGKSLIAVLHARSHGRVPGEQAVLIRYNEAGGKIWQRSFNFGAPNEIFGIAPAGKLGYIATGRITLESGNTAGWALLIDERGSVQWQRTYPRGVTAQFKQAAVMPDATEGQAFVFTGEIKPADGGPLAAWVVAVDVQGTPLWLRYIRARDFAFSPAGLLINDDGRIMAALNATVANGDGNRNHIRLVTLSPHGAVLTDEAYIEGLAAQADDFVRGPDGQRIVTATIDSDEKPMAMEMTNGSFKAVMKKIMTDKAGPAPEPTGQNGWVFIAAAPPAYTDPCTKP